MVPFYHTFACHEQKNICNAYQVQKDVAPNYIHEWLLQTLALSQPGPCKIGQTETTLNLIPLT